MGSQRFIFMLIGLFVLSPLSVAQDTAAGTVIDEAAQVTGEQAGDDSWMKERIQKFREINRQPELDAPAPAAALVPPAAEDVQPDAVTTKQAPADTTAVPAAASSAQVAGKAATSEPAAGKAATSEPAAGKAATSEPAAVEAKKVTDTRVSVEDRRRLQYREAMEKQREARQAQARERRAAREQQHKARMEHWLQQQEERQQQAIARHEAMRDKAEDEHNFLVQNYDDMLQKALQEKVDVANRHEQMRKEADQRRKKYAAFRTAIKHMTPAERREYMDKHREELFPGGASDRPPAMPASPPPFGGMHSQPPVPPWYR